MLDVTDAGDGYELGAAASWVHVLPFQPQVSPAVRKEQKWRAPPPPHHGLARENETRAGMNEGCQQG